ncbi:MAG: phosphate acyltransferase PlsX [Phyllobacteriaceae bacterium]|nr:phosphate acyltransferase PlsX [Phyllobacteriaceae bacterium]
MITISIDAMGGDIGPAAVLPGLAIALRRRPDIKPILFGRSDAINPVLDGLPGLKAVATIVHCDVSVSMDDKPSQALRAGRYKSSMWRAIEATKTGDAMACVSAGNTGALMAMSKFCLRTMANIERPAIAAIWPTVRAESIVLDVGATIGADAQQLVDFAILGAALARSLLDIERPTVGLLNVGVEEIKGQEEVKEAGQLLRLANLTSLSYHGFVEGNDIGKGTVDVVVTEGFAGNIALKTAEGTARQIATYLREAMSRTLLAKLGYILARGAFDVLREKWTCAKPMAGCFLVSMASWSKAHGGTDAEGFAAAVELAYQMAKNRIIEKIAADLSEFHGRAIIPAAAAQRAVSAAIIAKDV